MSNSVPGPARQFVGRVTRMTTGNNVIVGVGSNVVFDIPGVTDWVGVNVFEANKPIVDRLKDDGKLIKRATYDHNYPHCWRTDQPLIYRAVNS